MRMAPATLAAGPVLCGLCGSEFTAGAQKANGRPEREGREADGGATSVLGRGDGDHDVLRRWNERRGTPDEQPMPAATADEADRRSRMARSLLKADGTLHGPTLRAADGTEFQAGDRVQAVSDRADLPAGTLGTIERVDAENASVEVDFATWGRLQAILTDDLARNLRHDYAEVEAPEPEPVGQGIEL